MAIKLRINEQRGVPVRINDPDRLAFSVGGSLRYEGAYEVTPLAHEAQTLQTRGRTLTEDITVKEVPYYETDNMTGGRTVYIASEV